MNTGAAALSWMRLTAMSSIDSRSDMSVSPSSRAACDRGDRGADQHLPWSNTERPSYSIFHAGTLTSSVTSPAMPGVQRQSQTDRHTSRHSNARTFEASMLIVSGTSAPSGTRIPGKRCRSTATMSIVRITCGWLTMYLRMQTYEFNSWPA